MRNDSKKNKRFVRCIYLFLGVSISSTGRAGYFSIPSAFGAGGFTDPMN